MIATLNREKKDYSKSNIYLELQLSIAKETKNVESEADALLRLGHNYRSRVTMAMPWNTWSRLG